MVPEHLLGQWGGADEETPMEGDDYERACNVDGYCGVIELANGEAFVVADEPNPATWVPHDSGGKIVRWMAADREEDLLDLAQNIEDRGEPRETVDFDAAASRLALFDSAYAGTDAIEAEIVDVLWIELESGRYRIDTYHEETEDTWIAVHDFRRILET